MHYTLHIKNMVCNRCIKVVSEELKQLNISINHIELGKSILPHTPSSHQLSKIKNALTKNGFELINNKKQQIVDQIKTYIIEQIHHQTQTIPEARRFSQLIAQDLTYDYSYLSHLFSTEEGTTIEKYIILQKVERIKELLSYHQLSIKEIAFQMNYSSAQHLSNQFKKITGFTPSAYKKLKRQPRLGLDTI